MGPFTTASLLPEQRGATLWRVTVEVELVNRHHLYDGVVMTIPCENYFPIKNRTMYGT
jgi:hypothetical protein